MLEVLEVLLLRSGDGHFSYSCQVLEPARISGNSYCFLPLKEKKRNKKSARRCGNAKGTTIFNFKLNKNI
jgi:hypothetical protein